MGTAQIFNPNTALKLLGVDSNVNNVADFGCGYGTFATPAAQVIRHCFSSRY